MFFFQPLETISVADKSEGSVVEEDILKKYAAILTNEYFCFVIF